jgi:hypothetical protein
MFTNTRRAFQDRFNGILCKFGLPVVSSGELTELDDLLGELAPSRCRGPCDRVTGDPIAVMAIGQGDGLITRFRVCSDCRVAILADAGTARRFCRRLAAELGFVELNSSAVDGDEARLIPDSLGPKWEERRS